MDYAREIQELQKQRLELQRKIKNVEETLKDRLLRDMIMKAEGETVMVPLLPTKPKKPRKPKDPAKVKTTPVDGSGVVKKPRKKKEKPTASIAPSLIFPPQ